LVDFFNNKELIVLFLGDILVCPFNNEINYQLLFSFGGDLILLATKRLIISYCGDLFILLTMKKLIINY
jgi:hypothetical protein